MKKFTLIIAEDDIQKVREFLENTDFPTEGLSDAMVLQELFYVDDRGRFDLDIRSEISIIEED